MIQNTEGFSKEQLRVKIAGEAHNARVREMIRTKEKKEKEAQDIPDNLEVEDDTNR